MPSFGPTPFTVINCSNKTFSSNYGVGMLLHAKQITFWHPEKQWVTVQAGWPEKKQNILTRLIELDA